MKSEHEEGPRCRVINIGGAEIPVSFDDVWAGVEREGPLERLPASCIMEHCVSVICCMKYLAHFQIV